MSGASSVKVLRVGTRKSDLALKQAETVIEQLRAHYPDVDYQICYGPAPGDTDKQLELYKFASKGVWTSDLEAMLVRDELDIIVHSLKDMPTSMPDNCVLGCIPSRLDARDIVVFRDGTPYRRVADLPAGSIIGTSSIRRIAQIRRLYPTLAFANIRGNIDTRVKKLNAEDSIYSAIILGAAGPLRMGREDQIHQYFGSEDGGIYHAVGQGGLGVEARVGDEAVLEMIRSIVDPKTNLATTVERSIMRTLEGGCSVPIGVETRWVGGDGAGDKENKLHIRSIVVSVDGTQCALAEATETIETVDEADQFGQRIAMELTKGGADVILAEINKIRGENKA